MLGSGLSSKIVLVIIFVVSLYVYYHIWTFDATYMRSPLDNTEYLVQNLDHKEGATYLLSLMHMKINTLRNHFLSVHDPSYAPYQKYIDQFCKRIKGIVLYENAPDGKYTSFTVNKGDEMGLCLRSRKTGELHDQNLITYVVLHELAHVACPEQNHTDLFKEIFIFMIRTAEKLGIYEVVDYQLNPQEYCGMTLDEKLV